MGKLSDFDKNGNIIFTLYTFAIFILIAMPIYLCLVGCGMSAEEKAKMEQEKQDSTIQANDADIKAKRATLDSLKALPDAISTPNVRHWSSSETKLPSGVVEGFDCAGCRTSSADTKNNYVTIKKNSGVSTIVRDIDEDLYLNLSIGDIIE